MKYIKSRDKFKSNYNISNTKIVESFDMSGGSGPMGNDINWGDSLVGRMFNSIFRSIGVGIDLVSINNVIKEIGNEFESMRIESKSNNVEESKITKLNISYLLEALTKSVNSGTKVSIIKYITKESIETIKKSKLDQTSKSESISELEEFLKFLEKYNEEIGEELSDDLTGIDSSEEKISKSGWGDKSYSGMVKMIESLSAIIDSKNKVETKEEVKEKDKNQVKNIEHIKDRIIKSLKEVYKTPLIQIFVTSREDSIYFREEKLLYVNKENQFIANVGKWNGQKGEYNKSEKPRIIEITNKTVSNFSSHIANKIKETVGNKDIDKDVKLSTEEVNNFNKNIVGKWVFMMSIKGNYYCVQVTNINQNGEFKNSTIWKIDNNGKPVERKVDYGPTKISSLFKRGIIFDKREQSLNKLKEVYKSDRNTRKSFNYKGEYVDIIYKEGDITKIKLKDGSEKMVKSSEISIRESYKSILESTEPKDYTDLALSRIKLAIESLESDNPKPPSISSEFLKNISDTGSKNLLNKLAENIKEKYNQVSESIQSKPLYESNIDDTILSSPKEKQKAISLRDKVSEKIARFASVSMLFVGEGLYGELGELGKHLENFNNHFENLLETDFADTTNESKIFKYSKFVSINEKKTDKEISEEIKKYYNENVNYNKWTVTKEEVESVDREIENSNPKEIGYDRILRISKLFNKAYKIHTKEVIPSGRKNGKVSNRVFRKWEYVGDGSSNARPSEDGGVDPGIGPYRNKKVFNKFEESILGIIENPDYNKIFTKNVKIKGKKESSGEVLLKFINSLLDGGRLYRSGAQSKFLSEYFGIKVDDSDLGLKSISKNKEIKSESVDEKDSKEFNLIAVNFISMAPGILCAINQGNQDFRYLLFLSEDKDYFYVKFSKSISQIEKYFNESNIEINRGVISRLNRERSDIFFGRIRKVKANPKLKKGDSINIEYVNATKYRNDTNLSSEKTQIKLREIYALLNGQKSPVKLPSGAKTSYGDYDSDKYGDFKRILMK